MCDTRDTSHTYTQTQTQTQTQTHSWYCTFEAESKRKGHWFTRRGEGDRERREYGTEEGVSSTGMKRRGREERKRGREKERAEEERRGSEEWKRGESIRKMRKGTARADCQQGMNG